MQLLVLHLSDAHFGESGNSIERRGELIAAATLSCATPDCAAILVVFSGDIADSGAKEEYKVAERFCTDLRARLMARGVPVYFIFVPGNHDCDFRAESDVRQSLQDFPLEKLVSVDPNGDIASHAVQVQSDFFEFTSRFNGYAVPSTAERMAFQQDLEIGGHHVLVRSYNTAWLSQLHEHQGRLCVPSGLLKGMPEGQPLDLAISVFHHSYPWLESTNGRAFRMHVEHTSDLVLTGHDHVSDSYSRKNLTGTVARYTEGDVLQEKGSTESGFNVIILDVLAKREKVFRYSWTTDLYERANDPEWVPFLRNPALSAGQFINNDNYSAFLSDPGSGFTHRYKKDIKLEDIFVYPDIKLFKTKPDPDVSDREVLRGEDLVDFLDAHPLIVIIGAERTGKTSLAKTLYGAVKVSNRVPLLLSGDDLRSADAERFWALAESKFVAQYRQTLLDRFRQLSSSNRVLIIDDFDKVKLNRRGQKFLVDHALSAFGTVVVFADDLFRLQELTETLDAAHPFHRFEQAQILEFGYALRGELIEKWSGLGREMTAAPEDLAREAASAEKLVTTVIGKNLLPSSPITILTTLQAHEAGQQQNTIGGSYGYIFEVLITAALSKVSPKGIDIDTKYTFLGLVAHYLFAAEIDSLSLEQLRDIQEQYFSRYRIRLNLEQILSDLVESRLMQELNGLYQFRYKYAYYYFVARYLKENLDDLPLDTRTSLNEMADKIYYEDYSNILMFFVYLTRDRGVIDRLISNAEAIFAEYEPCDFESHVAFINKLFSSGSQSLEAPTVETAQHRQEHRRQLDLEMQADSASPSTQRNSRLVAYRDDLDEVIKLNIALKTLEILGQVLRNFPGSLRGDIKARLAEQAYLLGLRTIRALMAVAEKNLEDLRQYFANVIKERRVVKPADLRELAKNADELLMWTSVGCAYSLVKRVSGAVGLEELSETYKEVLERASEQLPFALIDFTLKLDHFSLFPDREVHDLAKRFRKNSFGYSLIRHLIVDHMYLFPVDYRVRQRMGELLNIKSSHPLLINNRNKRLKE